MHEDRRIFFPNFMPADFLDAGGAVVQLVVDKAQEHGPGTFNLYSPIEEGFILGLGKAY